MSDKPTHVKPAFYSYVYEGLKEVAEHFGYNLLIHGSINRDLDLVAVPWVDKPKSAKKMIEAFAAILGGSVQEDHKGSKRPGGRKGYVIEMNRGGHWNNYQDKQYYLDISVY